MESPLILIGLFDYGQVGIIVWNGKGAAQIIMPAVNRHTAAPTCLEVMAMYALNDVSAVIAADDVFNDLQPHAFSFSIPRTFSRSPGPGRTVLLLRIQPCPKTLCHNQKARRSSC